MTTKRIDQFAATVAAGDGVTNGLLFTRSLLRDLGFESDIYSFTIPDQMAGQVLPARTFHSSQCDLLMYHHSMGHDHGPWLLQQKCTKAMVYHNITPPEFFPEGGGLRRYAELGLEQLREWRDEFVHALADSPLNESELVEAGYTRSKTLPLLVDTRRLEGTKSQPGFMREQPDDTRFYLAVGRLAENKRQYLLIEAFYHLLQNQNAAEQPPQRLIIVGGTTSEAYARGLQLHVRNLGLEDSVLLVGKCSEAELRWLYQDAHQYWCASAHEGFCMPLLEANYASLPVVTQARSNIPDTLGEGGLLLESDDPVEFALAAHFLNTEPGLYEAMVAAGHRNLLRYERENLRAALAIWLEQLDLISPVKE
ncbi:glycosyltransferase [Pseudomonas sp. SLFW]|uniref:glycosyltransferase n=1 Tax=Pseudomonas sp. SLFW TaxID=2683259 RepID=UPI0014128E5C|nr:glycosyltransferase [Pseudomonas sp. SLFW]NBB13544.1 glycosyltransferase [Pseudomonas sp. SLFW]